MSSQSQGSLAVRGAIAGGAGVVAFVVLMVVREPAFAPVFFFGIAVVVSISLLIAFHRCQRVLPWQAPPREHD